MNSLRARLALGLSLTLLLLLSVQWLVIHGGTRQLLEAQGVARLEHDVEALLVGLTFDAEGVPQVDDGRLIELYQRPYSGHYYQIEVAPPAASDAPGGEVTTLRSRSLWDQRLVVPRVAVGAGLDRNTAGPRGQYLLLVAHGYEKGGRRIAIAVAEDVSEGRGQAHALQWVVAVTSAATIAVLLIVQWLLVSGGLAPLRRLRRDVQRLRGGEIPALDEHAPDEVLPLVEEINALLASMERRLGRSRTALGDLAHALKTPLARIVQLGDDPRLPPELREELGRHARRMTELAERELSRARLAGGGHGRSVRPGAELEPLGELLRRIHPHLALDLAIPADLTVAVDREDFLELSGNLMENACKWGETRVKVSMGRDAEGSWLRVEDDGPGCDPDALDRIVRRGERLDERKEGHGLGLSIVNDIVADYGGELRFSASEALGGLCAEVKLG